MLTIVIFVVPINSNVYNITHPKDKKIVCHGPPYFRVLVWIQTWVCPIVWRESIAIESQTGSASMWSWAEQSWVVDNPLKYNTAFLFYLPTYIVQKVSKKAGFITGGYSYYGDIHQSLHKPPCGCARWLKFPTSDQTNDNYKPLPPLKQSFFVVDKFICKLKLFDSLITVAAIGNTLVWCLKFWDMWVWIHLWH